MNVWWRSLTYPDNVKSEQHERWKVKCAMAGAPVLQSSHDPSISVSFLAILCDLLVCFPTLIAELQ